MQFSLRTYGTLTSIVWTIVVSASLIFNITKERESTQELAREAASK